MLTHTREPSHSQPQKHEHPQQNALQELQQCEYPPTIVSCPEIRPFLSKPAASTKGDAPLGVSY